MNNTVAAAILAIAFIAQPWTSHFFGYSQLEHDASKALCEETLAKRMAQYLNVSERISTLTLATCKVVK